MRHLINLNVLFHQLYENVLHLHFIKNIRPSYWDDERNEERPLFYIIIGWFKVCNYFGHLRISSISIIVSGGPILRLQCTSQNTDLFNKKRFGNVGVRWRLRFLKFLLLSLLWLQDLFNFLLSVRKIGFGS